MPALYPYTIVHLQLSDLDDYQPGSGNHYIVLWFEKIPLGHIWLNESEKNQSSVVRWYGETIIPTLQYYIERKDAANQEWISLVEKGQFKQLHSVLKDLGIGSSYITNKETLSVIICTRNRTDTLKKSIDSLLNSIDKDFELIIVDNAPSNNETADLLKNYPNVRYILEAKKGLSFARNTGVKAATGNIISFTDDDVIVDKLWTQQMKQAFENRLTMAVTGLVLPEVLDTEAQVHFERYWGFNKGYLPLTFDHRYFLHHLNHGVPVWNIGAGANMAFRREIFDLAGGFDIRLGAGASGCSDDSEFWYRVLATGWNCEYNPRVFVFHLHRQTNEQLISQLFYYMRGLACSLLIQNEKFDHKGNLVRLSNLFTRYYYNRIKKRWRTGKEESYATIFTEMRGCFSGWIYYHFHKKDRGYDFPFSIPKSLYEEMRVPVSPVVSVVIPCYNQARFLARAIESVKNQTYDNCEIIVVDDGSDDDPKSVCKKFQGIEYVRVERVGLSAARNIGLWHSNGSHIVFLDADDWLSEDGIETNLQYFTSKKNIVFVSGAHDKVDERGDQIPSENASERPENNYISLLQGNYIGMEATVMYRRDLFFAFHFDPTLRAGEDYDINLRIMRHFPVYGHTHKIATYLFHQNNMSRNNQWMLKWTLDVIKRQEKELKNDDEKRALQDGVRNWKNYYQNLSASKK
ncbi:MAG: hypothetical protein C5B59_08905 [Bacteroidetes bacterium]|nr:MAG: hypothetical protein C5B59_08905 [Bacteroidota bacterium]